MNRRDRGIVAALSALLVVLAIATAVPPSPSGDTSGPGASDTPGPSAPTPSAAARIYREGTIGSPSSITPLTARTQADRDLATLIFSGLVAIGPDGTYLPDLASGWTVDTTGKHWTFTLSAYARWQDGQPVTATDVLFTVGMLKDPAYTGALGASWRDVTAKAIDAGTVEFDLSTPIGGFLQDATIGLLPAHLLQGTAARDLGGSSFADQPVGSGLFALVSWTPDKAVLVPAVAPTTPVSQPGASGSPVPAGSSGPLDSSAPVESAGPSDAPSASGPTATVDPNATAGAATPGPSATPSASPDAPRPAPALSGIEFHFFQDAQSLATAYENGEVDAASGLPAALARQLGALSGSQLISYPRTTLTGIALNLRPGNDDLRVVKVRMALLEAIDRAAIVSQIFDSAATRADSPIPPSSWAYDPKANKAVAYNIAGAGSLLKSAGWKHGATGWIAPGQKKVFSIELIAPDAASNATANLVAQAVAIDWRALGIQVNVVSLSASDFVTKRLTKGLFQAAAIDVNIGLDPDLYPLFGSTQALEGGSNVTGIQDLALDHALIAARTPAPLAQRKVAFTALETWLTGHQYILPVAFRDELVVVRDRVVGPASREIGDSSDRFWDVLTWRLADGG